MEGTATAGRVAICSATKSGVSAANHAASVLPCVGRAAPPRRASEPRPPVCKQALRRERRASKAGTDGHGDKDKRRVHCWRCTGRSESWLATTAEA